MDIHRHDIELRDVSDREVLVSYNWIARAQSMSKGIHSSDWLPIEVLSLFDGPTVDCDDLTAEERDWIECESQRIEFKS